MTGMTLKAIAQACGGVLHGDNGNTKEVLGVELDSRKLQEGYLFLATKGERVDGHSFIPQAFEKGCYGVVCEKMPEEPMGPCILVEDSFQALQDIATYYRKQLSVKVVGITGSVGKTSTKEVIASALGEKFNVLKTEGNFNNEIGLPLTVLKIRNEHEVAVLEMGINHFGEMHRLSRIAQPDVCVITNIGQCHLEFLGDRDGVLKAKTEMFDFMKEALSGKVKEVRLSQRLKSHPFCLTSDGELSLEMEKVLNAMPSDNKVKAEKVLEINSDHGIFAKLQSLYNTDKEKLKKYSQLLYTQSLLIEGISIEDPVEFSNMICELMMD